MAAALGAAYTLGGRIPEAVALLTPSMEQLTTVERIEGQMQCQLALGEAQLRAGLLGAARTCTEQALDLARAHQERGRQAYALRLLGEIHVHCHPPEAALADAAYGNALSLASELGMRPLQAHCHRGLGTLYTRIGRLQQARAALATAIDLYRTMEMTFWLPEAEAALAQVGKR
jgi:tetratricopeptide (TPR) repeat protein